MLHRLWGFALFLFPALIWSGWLGQSEKEKQNENEYLKTSSHHLLISSSPNASSLGTHPLPPGKLVAVR